MEKRPALRLAFARNPTQLKSAVLELLQLGKYMSFYCFIFELHSVVQ